MRLWRGRRQREDRIRQHLATADDERAVLRRQLDELLRILASVGATADSVAVDAVKGIPAGLMAASSVHHRPGGYPVRVTTGTGREVIAVVEGIGSAALWWDEIQAKAGRPTAGALGIGHAHLSPGLSVIATRDAGAMALTVSTALPASARRAAVVTALRAARRAGWTNKRVPALLVPLAGPALLYSARHVVGRARVPHLVAAGTATVGAVGLAVALLATPAHRPARAIPPAASPTQPIQVRRTRHVTKAPKRNRLPHPTSPAGGAAAEPSVMAESQPAQPQPSPSAPMPTPSPTPSPSTSPAPDPCIPLLLVCVDID